MTSQERPGIGKSPSLNKKPQLAPFQHCNKFENLYDFTIRLEFANNGHNLVKMLGANLGTLVQI